MHRDELANATGGRGPRIRRRFHGPNVAPDEHGYIAGTDIFGADEHHIGGLDHGVGGFHGSNESARFDHSERVALSFHLVDPDDIMVLPSMQRTVRTGGLFRSLVLALTVCSAASCSQGEDTSPAVATAEVTVARQRVAQGSPVDVTYRFQAAGAATSSGPFRVFVHVVDADEELMWTDDHEPPAQPNSWQPGQKIEYTRTMFVPTYPYVGEAKVILGIYDTTTSARVKLGNTDRGDRSYQVAAFELMPQTENVYLIYKDGWHSAEVAPENPGVEWKWTRKEATVNFRNPKRDATLILQMDNPSQAPSAATEVEVFVGGQSLGVLPIGPGDAPVRKLPMTTAQMGSTDLVEVRFVANRTFVPALEPTSKSNDTRELGVRLFHAFVQPNQ